MVSWLSLSLALFSLLVGFVQAASDLEEKLKIGNNTIERTVQLRTHSLFAPYIDQDLQNRWWDFGGDSYVNTNKHVRLTRHAPSQMGWLWSRLPLTSSNYVIEVEFKVTGDSTHLYGDGMAVWLTKTRAEPGPVFGSIDKFNGLAIFLDTYANSRHPYSFPRITAMLGDGNTAYDHDHDGEANSIGACTANFRQTNVATKLRMTYIKDTWLDVKIQFKAWDDWTDCFQVRNIKLPEDPFLGFSALTGDVVDSHDIIAVTTYSAVVSREDAQRDKLREPNVFAKARGSWFGFLFKLALFGGVCYGAYIGYQQYVLKKGNPYRGGGGRDFNFGGSGGFSNPLSSGKRF